MTVTGVVMMTMTVVTRASVSELTQDVPTLFLKYFTWINSLNS